MSWAEPNSRLSAGATATSYGADVEAKAGKKPFKVSAKVSDNEPEQGETIKIRGEVKPARPGQNVRVQVRYGTTGKWVTKSKVRLNKKSKYVFKDEVTTVQFRQYRVVKSAAVSKERFGVDLEPAPGETEEQKKAIIADAEVIFAAAAAGVRVISTADMAQAKNLLAVADVNAVPPPGVEGMELFMDGAPLPGCNALGVGPLAIGDIKYKTESGLFKRMITSDKALHLDFRDAFQLARTLAA